MVWCESVKNGLSHARIGQHGCARAVVELDAAEGMDAELMLVRSVVRLSVVPRNTHQILPLCCTRHPSPLARLTHGSYPQERRV
ncbi:hypothetical protein E2C01_023635 [Portunus trituberculatus]|uniref:Uncharacterized protein n=1 Tax=Portunus trituberculatus TaxID=210409 RepID=A0A5B7EBM8_PORTR|nr:hypothetical protein [Portunus trituberculatus]